MVDANDKRYLTLNDIECYRISFHLSNYVWDVVVKWDVFAKRTVGAQFVDAADSISANIAEGFGRHLKKIKLNFTGIVRALQKKALTGMKSQGFGN